MYESVVTSIDTIAWAERDNGQGSAGTAADGNGTSGLDMAAVLLDMRKAFDLLSRRYLRCVLRIATPDRHGSVWGGAYLSSRESHTRFEFTHLPLND